MKPLKNILIIASAMVFPLQLQAQEEESPLLEFATSYLLGKAADAVWDSATGKPDIRELEARLERLEKLLGGASAPISQLRANLGPSTTAESYRRSANGALAALEKSVKDQPGTLAHVYVGSVGRLKAVFSLDWAANGTVSGVYCNPTRDASMIYTLIGDNPREGFIRLREYTHSNLTARLELRKSLTPGWIIWSGKMHNTDGRVLDVTFQRERK